MKRKAIKWLSDKSARLRNAWRVLTRKHYFLFSTDREVDGEDPNSYYDVEWREMRRQDAFQVGTLCLGLLAEDDECQSLVDEANDLLK